MLTDFEAARTSTTERLRALALDTLEAARPDIDRLAHDLETAIDDHFQWSSDYLLTAELDANDPRTSALLTITLVSPGDGCHRWTATGLLRDAFGPVHSVEREQSTRLTAVLRR